MGKDNSIKSNKHDRDGRDSVGENIPPEVAPTKNEVTLIFRHRRRTELYIGRKLYVFEPNEAKKVPASILEHPDFTPAIRKNFTIKGV